MCCSDHPGLGTADRALNKRTQIPALIQIEETHSFVYHVIIIISLQNWSRDKARFLFPLGRPSQDTHTALFPGHNEKV